jgi:hypothetical protein
MGALRDIILIPEAKINLKKVRTVDSVTSAQEMIDFFKNLDNPSDPPPVPANPALTRPKAASRPGKQNQVEWRNHKSIQNPKWYGSSIRTSISTENNTLLPIFIGTSVLQNRPVYRALEGKGFEMVERETPTIQHVDMILTPQIGVIFQSFAKLSQTDLLHRAKSAMFYFPKVVIIFEVVPFRLFTKDPKAVSEFNPLEGENVKALSTLRRALAVPGDMMGSVEIGFALNGAEEVAMVLRGLGIKSNTQIARNCSSNGHKDIETLWRDKQWVIPEIASPHLLHSVMTWQLIKGREGGSKFDRSRIQSVLDPFHHWSPWGIRGFRRGYDG